MVLKPSELEQKAEEQKKIAIESSVAELEAKIDKHLIYFADELKQNQKIKCEVSYDIPEAVVLGTVKKYEAAGWEVTYDQFSEYYRNLTLIFKRNLTLIFKPK